MASTIDLDPLSNVNEDVSLPLYFDWLLHNRDNPYGSIYLYSMHLQIKFIETRLDSRASKDI